MKKNRCGGQKKKKRKERERREKEDEDRDASVSTNNQLPPPSSLSAPLLPPTTPRPVLPTRRPPVTMMTVDTDDSDDDYEPYATFAPPTQWPAHIQEFVYGPRPPAEILADAIPPAPVDPSPMVTLVDACLEGPPLQPLPIPPRTVTSVMRDWSALRVECVNPWRTIRRRKQRLRPRYADTCPRAPRVVTPAAVSTLSPPKPVPVMSLLEGRSQPLPLQPTQVFALVPLHPDDPIHPDDVPTNDLPLPLACPCPDDHLAGPRLLSADTPFGWVGSSLALACAWELPEPDKVLDALAFLAWGSSEDVRRDCLADLPPDLFVFLGVLSMVSVLECDFGQFLVPAGSSFIKHWVDGLG
ncbi:hypothetical protein R3P38DRAFT_3223623 [Favolaschia claudopus]|uniref:Uncharacterized protein n=1 Tax=Favolaschia claudopus TaxID=2862362 RepID=A0AAV9ZWR4_9AGAR